MNTKQAKKLRKLARGMAKPGIPAVDYYIKNPAKSPLYTGTLAVARTSIRGLYLELKKLHKKGKLHA